MKFCQVVGDCGTLLNIPDFERLGDNKKVHKDDQGTEALTPKERRLNSCNLRFCIKLAKINKMFQPKFYWTTGVACKFKIKLS